VTSKQEGKGKGLSRWVWIHWAGCTRVPEGIVRNATQRAWWVRMRLCTNSGVVYSLSSFDDVVCLYYWVTLVLSVCALFIAGVELLVP